jgi:hypothetical protein
MDLGPVTLNFDQGSLGFILISLLFDYLEFNLIFKSVFDQIFDAFSLYKFIFE